VLLAGAEWDDEESLARIDVRPGRVAKVHEPVESDWPVRPAAASR
jgi:hypothetical protein